MRGRGLVIAAAVITLSATALPSTVGAGVPRQTGDPAALAARVVAGGADGEAALREALTASGIEIATLKGATVAAPAEPAQGLRVIDQELPLMVKSAEGERSVSVDDLLADLADLAGQQLDANAVRPIFFADLDDTSSSPLPTRAFFTNFLQALGQARAQPTDLLGSGGADVPLSFLQSELILLRLAGDLRISALQAGSGTPGAFAGSPVIGRALPAAPAKPCSVGDAAGTIQDTAALAMSWHFQEMIKYLGETWGATAITEAAETKIPLVGAVLALLKVVETGAAFEGHITLEGGEPLVRTKKRRPGEQRVLKAEVKLNIGKGQLVNCLRHALNIAGLDASLPNDGPIGGARVNWHVVALKGGANADLDNPLQIYGIGGSPATPTTTDDDGVSKTGLEGAKQRVVLPDDVTPYPRIGEVVATINLKTGKMYQDLLDALGVLTSGVGLPVALLSGMFERSGFLGVTKAVNVKDWAKDFAIDTNADFYNPGGEDYPHATGVKCGGLAGEWNVTASSGGESGQFIFTLDENGKGFITSDAGRLEVSFVPGDPPKLKIEIPGIGLQQFTVVPGNYCQN